MTTRWVVGGTVTASPAITPSGMSYSQLLNAQPWLQFRRPPTWSPTPNLGQLISSYQPGAMAGLQLWMFIWYLPTKTWPYMRLLPLLAMPWMWAPNNSHVAFHPSACRFAGIDFIAVVVETLGSLTKDFIQVHCSTLQPTGFIFQHCTALPPACNNPVVGEQFSLA